MNRSSGRSGGNSRRMEISGSLTIDRVAAIRLRMLRAMPGARSLSVRFRSVTGVDASFMQLWAAFNREASERGIVLRIPGELPAGLSRAAMACGLPGCFIHS